ncbi:unnamed protein product [Prunus brigantina]
MNNLGPSYDMIASAVQARDTLITYDTLLLTTKRRMLEQVVPMPNNGLVACMAARGHVTGPFGESSTSATPRIICQICGKDGHPAVDRFQSMNMAYEGRIPAQHLTSMALSPSSVAL